MAAPALLTSALLAVALLAGCAQPEDAPAPPAARPPEQASRFVDGQPAPRDGVNVTVSVVQADPEDPCPVSNEGLQDFPGAFMRLREEAVPEEPAAHETTVFERCPTAFRWATTRTSEAGLFMQMRIEAGGAYCLSHFAAAGSRLAAGPAMVGLMHEGGSVGWGASSRGTARVHVLDADSNDIIAQEGQWAGATGTGFAQEVTLAVAAHDLDSWDNELTDGWAAILVVVCEEPFGIAAFEAGRAAHLFDAHNLEGGVGLDAVVAGATLQGQGHAQLGGEAGHMYSGAFVEQAWRLTLDHPEGSQEFLVTPADFGLVSFTGKPGDYTLTLDKADRPVFSYWWALLAGATPGAIERFV